MSIPLFCETESIINQYKQIKSDKLNQTFNNYKNQDYLFIRDVEIAFYSLNEKERFFFHNEFFLGYKDKPNWWKLFFTNKEYEDISLSACNRFIKRFYEIR